MRLVALVLLAVALPAAAAPPVKDPAREHYERGLAKYNLAEFDAAIVEFKQSYELSKAPRLLFNLAQAYRLKKDWESALYFYSTYLRAEPNPPNKSDVEAKIDEMKHAVEEQRKQQPPLPPAPAPAPATVAPPAQTPPPVAPPPVHAVERRPSRRTLLIAGATAAGVGVAALAVGGGLLGLAASDANTLHGVATSGMPWSSADDSIYRAGDRSQTAGIALCSIGGALVIGGGVALVFALRR